MLYTSWMDSANCIGKDPDIFFDPKQKRKAKELCRSCSVRVECFSYSLDVDSNLYGIWGGETKGFRDIIRSSRELGWSS